MPEADYGYANAKGRQNDLVVLTGCSGGGKSTLLAALGGRGYRIFEEPGRQIVKEQMLIEGNALPWDDEWAFAELCLSRSLHNVALALRQNQPAVFDRSLIDAISAYEHAGLKVPAHFERAAERIRYNPTVLMVPPWPEIFAPDRERRHAFDAAVGAYGTLVATYERLGYRIVDIPKMDVDKRVDFVKAHLPPVRF